MNSLGAATKLLDSGYFNACSAQLRDVAESAMLMRYFTLNLEVIDTWVRLEGKERYQRFGFGKICKLLPDDDPAPIFWRERFEYHSEFGTHPSAAAIYGVHDGDQHHIGPHVDVKKYTGFMLDIANDACEAVDVYIKLLNELSDSSLKDDYPAEQAAFENAKIDIAGLYCSQ